MKHSLKNIFYSFIVAFSIIINISIFHSLKELNISFLYQLNTIEIAVVAVLFYKFTKDNKLDKVSKGKKVLSLLFAIFMIVGESYAAASTYKLIFKNVATILVSLVKLGGFTYLFGNLFALLDRFLEKFKVRDLKFKNKYLSSFMELFDKYPFRTSLVAILLVIGLYMVAFYPIVLSPDPAFQIKMYFNEHTKYIDWVIQRDANVFMTAHHPVLQTFLLGWSISLGRVLINDNFGLFIYTVGQSLIYASVLAYTIKFARRQGLNNRYLFILLLIYLLVPMFAVYSVSAVKDTLYTAFMILFTLCVFDIVKNYRSVALRLKYLVYLYFVMLLIGLFRHNGVYVIGLTIFFLLFYSKKNALKLLLVFGVFFGSIYGFDRILVPGLGISDGSPREMLSVPFQQTARLVKEKPSFYNEEDREVIDHILNYDTLAERYKPNLADPVKNEYNKYTTKDDLKEYFRVWLDGLVHYPDIYVDATLNNTYGYFYPNTHNWYIYTKYNGRVTENDLVDYHYNGLVFLRVILDGYANAFPYIPVIGLMSNIGFGVWMVLILTVYLMDHKRVRFLITLLPLYGTIIFCIIGPANTYFRYTMPYLFVLPVLTMLLLNQVRGGSNEKK